MSDASSDQETIREEWHGPPKESRLTRGRLLVRRLILGALIAIALGVVVGILIWRNYLPRTYLVVVRAGGLRPLCGPTVPVAGREISLFEPLVEAGAVDYRDEEFNGLLASPESFSQFSPKIANLRLRPQDRLIVYIAAHGIALDREPQIVCENFDPRTPSSGSFHVSRLLGPVAESPADVKLIVWDAGQIDYDPGLGIVANEFPSSLKTEVEETKDSSLSVLCSHGDLERSHRSLALDGSVFGTFVVKGLRGAADREGNGDDELDVAELDKFVRNKVSSWVAEATGEAATQVPVLIHGVPEIKPPNQTATAEATSEDSESPDGESTEQPAALFSVSGIPDVEISVLIRAAEEDWVRTGSTAAGGEPLGYLADLAVPETEGQPAAADDDGGGGGARAPSGTEDATVAETSDAKATKADPRQRLAASLRRAWQMRDRLATVAPDAPIGSRPLDSTPHLWRLFQEELIAYELAVQGASIQDVPSAEELEAALARFEAAEGDKKILLRDFLQIRSPGAASAPHVPVEPSMLHTIALAKLLANDFAGIDTARIEQLDQTLNAFINAGPAEFTQQIAELKPTGDYEQFYELRLATQIGNVVRSQPELAQYALQVRRNGEQVAARGLWCAPWLEASIRDADRLRLAGERQMLDQIGSDWSSRAKQALDEADRRYSRAAQTFAEVARAIQLRNDLMFVAPYCVHLLRESGNAGAEWEEPWQTMSDFLDELIQFADLLEKDQPTSDDIQEVSRLHDDLQLFYETMLAAGFRRPAVENLLEGQRAEDSWRIHALLQTPLPDARARANMIERIRSFDANLAEGFDVSRAHDFDDPKPELVLHYYGLEQRLARLADPQAARRLGSLPQRDDKSLDEKLRAFSKSLRDLYRSIAGNLDSAAKEPPYMSLAEARQRAVAGTRRLQMLPVRDAAEAGSISIDTFGQNVQLYELLAWHRARFLSAQEDALAAEVAYLTGAAGDYAAQAASLFRPQSPLATARPDFELRVPPRVSLVVDAEREFDVALQYNGPGKADVRIVVEYDDRLIEVAAREKLYYEPHKHGEYPFRPSATDPPTLSGIETGETRMLPLKLKSIPGADRDAVLIVKAFTGASASPAYLRQTIEVPVRMLDVVLDSSEDTWAQDGDRMVLRTFPNRVTDYRFGVVNWGANAREVALRFFSQPADVDWSVLSPAGKRDLVNRLTPVSKLTIPAPAGGETSFAGEPPPAAPPPTAALPSAQPAPAPAEEKEKAPSPPTGRPIDRGMIVEVSDPKDPGQTFFKQLDIVAQRPRRYVRPKVQYNSRLQRIEVVVQPKSPQSLPRGRVKVECDLADDTDAAAEGKLRDFLTAPKYEARLFVNVLADPPREVMLYLNVDDYPRAFVYRVPIGSGVADQPEGVADAQVRLLKAVPGEYQAPAPVTNVIAQVDAPLSAFANTGDYVQMALDENLDNKFGPETGTSFIEDRQANSYFDQLSPEGVLSIDTRVTDFQVPLVTDRLQNVEIDVNSRMSLNGQPFNAEPLKLRIDGAGPRIPFVSVAPWGGFVVAGTELQVSVTAVDAMSGVKKVDIGFDLDGTGEFSEKAPPVAAALDPAPAVGPSGGPLAVVGPPSGAGEGAGSAAPRQWRAKLPTTDVLGVQTILVRATDGAGNASEIYAKRVQIITPEEAAAKIQQQAKVVEGLVVYRDRPVPAAELTLYSVPEPQEPSAAAATAEQPAPLPKQVATATADENGQFTLSGIAPGKYILSAQGVVRNVTRLGQQDVVVELVPGRVVRADLQLQ
jgi:hypothetical protein